MMIMACAIPGTVQAEVLRVGVSVLPLEELVESIGGESVEVMSLQQAGDSCSIFEPRPSTIRWLSGADVFFRVGAGYEPAILEKVESRFPQLTVLDLRLAVPVLALGEHAHHDHEHHACASCASHASEATDPHIWLDPLRLADMARWIAVRLGELRPQERGKFIRAAEEAAKRFQAIHAELDAGLRPYRGRAFYIYHPALAYFADRYGLEQVAIAASGEGPSARELHQLIVQAKKEGIGTIFIQPQESRKHAEVVARAVGAELAEIDPMSTDLEANLEEIGQALMRAFAED